ncbi:MAG: response regulator, partial [Lachnospiraceae bacterium]|nr:response regulator [Lachnospiraceae bacterium]
MSLLREAVSHISVYDTKNAFLLSKNGNIIYHKDYTDGLNMDLLPEAERKQFERYLSMEKDCVNLVKHIGRAPDKVVIKELRNGMLLGIDVPRVVIARPLLRLISLLFITSFLITIISILIGILWIRSVIKPLRKMTDVADRYAEGDFSEMMEVDSSDEVGRLSKSLQTMSASLKNQIENADAANKAKTAFLSNMSHEIRTPLNAVLGMNEMILRESGEDNTIVYAENIRTAGNTLLGLINDILDFSKIEAGKLEIVPVDYDISSVINDLVNMVRVRADQKGLALVLDINRDIPVVLNGDEVRVKQIITNILTNAVKYTEKGSVTFRIGYEKADEPGEIKLKVSVKDTGIGIREEDMERLFTKFERLDEKRFRNIEGTGLGMTIASTLLDMMGSALEVKSTYGEGSEFSFSLVQKVVKWDPVGDYETAYRSGWKAKRKHKKLFTAKNARVLMVDDNTMNIIVFESLIKETLVRADRAMSGDECLKMCADRKYDIIFLDHMMPEKDGIETLHELRAMKGGPNADTKVICLTANAISGAREEYIREGFDDYLTKPIDSDKLERMLRDYLPADKIDAGSVEPGSDVKESAADNEEIMEFYAAESYPGDHTGDDAGGSPEKRLEALDGQSLIDVSAGLKNCAYPDVYLMVLESVFSTLDGSLEELRSFKSANDMKNYAIKVH